MEEEYIFPGGNMKKTQFVKERLNKHLKMLKKLEAFKEELSFILARYGCPRSPNISGIPTGGRRTLSETEQLVQKKSELEEKIRITSEEVFRDWTEISSLFGSLAPMQVLILNLRYQYGAGWKDICRQIYGRREDYDDNTDLYMKRIFKEHGCALLYLSERYCA